MIVLPYRAKNPPDHFPYATIGLIAINLLVYCFTSLFLIIIRPGVVDYLAFSHNHYTIWRMITAMFLHRDILHIAGNMLFLWVFGASVEGRLGPWKYLAIYFLAGFAGFALEDIVISLVDPDAPCLGASGAIMGIAGSYLYIFPYSTICLLWGIVVPFAKAQWHARWLILYFIGLNVVEQVMSGNDGVAHLAHLGGFGVGLVGAIACRPRRDSLKRSDAQAIRSDVRDTRNMSLSDLEDLLTAAPEDCPLVVEYMRRLPDLPNGTWQKPFLRAIKTYGRVLIQYADPSELANIFLRLPPDVARELPGHYFLQLGARLDTSWQVDLAVQVYYRIFELSPASQDAEAALGRLGRLMDLSLNDTYHAHYYYSELISRFPHSPAADLARHTLEKMYQSGRIDRPTSGQTRS
jgi:membrane associated rhomboid family serine protease